jgi:hypothetical protein
LSNDQFVKEKFGLDEPVLEHYTCALDKKILLKGTLYLTETHVAFYSRHNDKTVFNGSTKFILPYTAIT